MRSLSLELVTASIAAASLSLAQTGRIVVVTDEWPLTNGRAFNAPNDAAIFATNVAAWFTGGGPGRFLAYSSSAGLNGTQLRAAMESAGHTWVVGVSVDSSLTNLLTFDGVFLAGGSSMNMATLTAYVQAGGNVYIAAGAGGFGGANQEAAYYNTFLESFGLRLAGPYSGTSMDVPITGTSPLLQGVDHLYAWGANQLTDLTPSDPAGSIIFSAPALQIGTYEALCSALPGDVNCDCVVSLNDLAALLSSFGTPSGATRADGDLDADGDVDLTDLATLLSGFGATC